MQRAKKKSTSVSTILPHFLGQNRQKTRDRQKKTPPEELTFFAFQPASDSHKATATASTTEALPQSGWIEEVPFSSARHDLPALPPLLHLFFWLTTLVPRHPGHALQEATGFRPCGEPMFFTWASRRRRARRSGMGPTATPALESRPPLPPPPLVESSMAGFRPGTTPLLLLGSTFRRCRSS